MFTNVVRQTLRMSAAPLLMLYIVLLGIRTVQMPAIRRPTSHLLSAQPHGQAALGDLVLDPTLPPPPPQHSPRSEPSTALPVTKRLGKVPVGQAHPASLQSFEGGALSALPASLNESARLPTVAPLPLTVVTAADSGHFLTLLGALWALRRSELDQSRVVIFDLGLKPCQRRYIEGLASCFAHTSVQSFDFDAYPSFFNISDRAGSYGWKPAIVSQVLAQAPPGGAVVWIDAGTELGRRLVPLLADSSSFGATGFISTVTTGTIHQWTHAGMVQWFEANSEATGVTGAAQVMKRERWASPCNGAFLGFRKGSSAEQALAPPWLACAMDQSCIAPEGSSRRNHRLACELVCTDHAHVESVTDKLVWSTGKTSPLSRCSARSGARALRFTLESSADLNTLRALSVSCARYF